MAATRSSLEASLQQNGSAVDMLRRSTASPSSSSIPSEFTNWRDEQEAWRTSAALFDQSHHMIDLRLAGPDVIRLLSNLGVNSFRTFGPNRAKQLVACNPDGFFIGDAVLFGLDTDRVEIVGRPPIANWVEFQAATGHYDVVVARSETSRHSSNRWAFRFEMQGPNV